MLHILEVRHFAALENTMQQTFNVFQLNVFYNYQLSNYTK